jgi:hypothetical protein
VTAPFSFVAKLGREAGYLFHDRFKASKAIEPPLSVSLKEGETPDGCLVRRI